MGTPQDREQHLAELRKNLKNWGRKHEGERRSWKKRIADEAQLRSLTRKITNVSSKEGNLDYHRDR